MAVLWQLYGQDVACRGDGVPLTQRMHVGVRHDHGWEVCVTPPCMMVCLPQHSTHVSRTSDFRNTFPEHVFGDACN